MFNLNNKIMRNCKECKHARTLGYRTINYNYNEWQSIEEFSYCAIKEKIVKTIEETTCNQQNKFDIYK